MKTKKCVKCGEVKNLTDFHRQKYGKDGVRTDCKQCVGRRLKKHREENIEQYTIKETKKRNREKESFDSRIRKMYYAAKNRAKKYGREFNIEVDDLVLAYPVDNKCPILNIELKWNSVGFQDNSPSLDRIDSTLGYIKNNIQIISVRANRIKNDSTIEELEKILNYLKFN